MSPLSLQDAIAIEGGPAQRCSVSLTRFGCKVGLSEGSMTAHLLVDVEKRPIRRADRLFRLDWREFWLLVSTLGGILALVGVVFLAYFSSR
jgi:hypothetical protein